MVPADGSAESEFAELLSLEAMADDGRPGDCPPARLDELRLRFGGTAGEPWRPAADATAVRFLVALTGLPASVVRADLAARVRRGEVWARLQSDGAVQFFEPDAEIRIPHSDFPAGFGNWAVGVPEDRVEAAAYAWQVLMLADRPLTREQFDSLGPRSGAVDVDRALADLIAGGWVVADGRGYYAPATADGGHRAAGP